MAKRNTLYVDKYSVEISVEKWFEKKKKIIIRLSHHNYRFALELRDMAQICHHKIVISKISNLCDNILHNKEGFLIIQLLNSLNEITLWFCEHLWKLEVLTKPGPSDSLYLYSKVTPQPKIVMLPLVFTKKLTIQRNKMSIINNNNSK